MKGQNNSQTNRKYKLTDAVDTTPLEPLNERQAEYINAIENNSMVLCIGVLGSAKTFIPAKMAAVMLMKKKIDKIVVARPTEGRGKSVGFFKGTKDDKLGGWCSPVTDTLKRCLGLSFFEYCLKVEKIELLALEQVKGRSWDDTFLIIDEAEDLDPGVAKSLVTRMGIRSQMVITGDLAQQDLYQHSGLQHLIQVAEYMEVPPVIINFDSWEYCVRGDEAKAWGMAFEAFERDHPNV